MIGHNHEKLRLRSIQSSRCDVPVLPLLLFLFFGASHSWFHCGMDGIKIHLAVEIDIDISVLKVLPEASII